jgi:hypothetical protein
MLSLTEIQNNFIATINEGPDALDPALFDGPIDRVLLGLKAHANTISHARLVALEETFPLTREYLGEAAFNRISRNYAETPTARASDNNSIGTDFPAFLALTGADQTAVELARVEFAWLESYHAADAAPLRLSAIAGLSEPDLLNLSVMAHPAARAVAWTTALPKALSDLAAILEKPATILTLRPFADVCLIPVDIATATLFAAAKKPVTIGNLLALAAEQPGMTDPAEPVMTLLGAGALVETGLAGDNRTI